MADADENESVTSYDESEMENGSHVSLMEEMEYTVNEAIEEYMELNVLNMSKPDFYETMLEEVASTVSEMVDNETVYSSVQIHRCVEEILAHHWELVEDIYPLRSEGSIAEKQSQLFKETVAAKLMELASTEYNQGTEEWYAVRSSVLTASSIWKVFASEAQRNSLIYEKCRGDMPPPQSQTRPFTVTNPMQHGHKYEPLSILLYEYLFKTRVQGYGCIIHPRYSFIGASPDGINVDPESSRYGRMVEIKNIVNRDITGVPKEEYWIQMQLQMEVCDLDTCDFIETRFQEYASEEECYEDMEAREYRGVMLYFLRTSSNGAQESNYIYSPFTMQPVAENRVQVNKWILDQKRECSMQGYHLYGQQYWYLDEFSCLLVRRNRTWFEAAVPKIEELWQIIQTEKQTGYKHRAPQKKRATATQHNLDWLVSKLESDIEENH